MFSIGTAPAKQSATDAIGILSGRLASASLLEDRRAAILSLRSFAKDFPATVASGALRDLIASLSKDGEDADTVKVVLETFLMLFNPNSDSPEASEEIMLWMADEFTQRQENITLILDFLETSEFYSRLYSLQLLGAILAARTERTEECVFAAPLGLSRLVAVLDDDRDAVRNEAISLLIGLTPTSTDIQKVVAFESAFERIFAIMVSEGSLNEGGRTVEDCLILLANLLRRNPSNQALFRESGCIKRLADLLQSLAADGSSEAPISPWAETQRNRNTYAFLALIRLLLQSRSSGVPQNQELLWKHGLCHSILQLAFHNGLQIEIKAEALLTCGDMVRDAKKLQETFAQLSINPSPAAERQADRAKPVNGEESRVYVIDGLLELTLNTRDSAAFDLRFAACECLKSYFSNHLDVRLHFLLRAIEGYVSGGNESANILNVLLRPEAGLSISDPYRQWFASTIAFHLVFDNPEGKAKMLSVAEGNASDGEEVVTSIQTITAHLITGINRGDDERILIGYLMLLCGWLFEDLDGVNEFLSEGSNIQALIQAISQPTVVCGEIVQGLCAMLLGIVYEFSTKDSPISRTSLHSILTTRMDRERFLDRINRLRSNPALRDFETTPQKRDPESIGGLADVFFDAVFVNFVKDNYGRISRALDRSPELEISVIANGVQKGVSRELVDSLREQLKETEDRFEKAKTDAVTLEAKLGEEQAEHRRAKEEAAKAIANAQSAGEENLKSQAQELLDYKNEQAAKDADFEKRVAAIQVALGAKEAEYQREVNGLRSSAKAEIEQIQRRAAAEAEQAQRRAMADIEQLQKRLTSEAEQSQRRATGEAADLKATISRLEVDLAKRTKEKEHELAAKNSKIAELEEQVATATRASAETEELRKKLSALSVNAPASSSQLSHLEQRLSQKEEERATVQSELDDLLMVFADLEEKAEKQKVRLRELGEPVSDDEDE